MIIIIINHNCFLLPALDGVGILLTGILLPPPDEGNGILDEDEVRDGEFLAIDERGVVVPGGVGPRGGTLASVGVGDTVLSLGGFILECEEVTSVEENVLALLLLRGWCSRRVSLWRKKMKQNEKDNLKSISHAQLPITDHQLACLPTE